MFSERNVVSGVASYAEAVKSPNSISMNNKGYTRQPKETRQQRMHSPQSTQETQRKQNTEGTHGQWDNRDRNFPRKSTISVIGDSMLKKVRKQDVNREAPHARTYIKTFPGATLDHMQSYIEPTLQSKPDGIIILCGTNNLKSDSPETIANKLVDLAKGAKTKVRNVAVSSIITRSDSVDLERKRIETNRLVLRKLEDTEIKFLDHENIEEDHLDKWGLQLNYSGNNILTGNLIDFINGM